MRTLWRLSNGRFTRRRALSILAVLICLAPPPIFADSLFGSPGLGMPPVPLPRVVPKTVPGGVPPLNANQCQLAAGACPLGRLQRSGGRCYCVSGNGTARQGSSRTRPQDARPPLDPSDP